MCKRIVNRSTGHTALKRLACAAAVALSASLATDARAVSNPPAVTKTKNQFFDWQVNTTPSYLPSPFLSDANANSVNAFLKTLPANDPKAIKITGPINNSTAQLIFNNSQYHISYVLGDFESASSTNQLKSLVNQVRFGNTNGSGNNKTYSYNAYVGNFNYTPIPNDGTKPSNYHPPTSGDYNSAKLNMAMPEMYAGSGSFRNPAAGNSTAPNIRSALFTLPILRVTATNVYAKSTDAVVPYIARFNNWANLSLDSDRNAANGYKFVPGQSMPAKNGLPAVSAADTVNQMLSRRDFATQVAHYRLRGADSFVAFEPGVVGYDNEQKRSDIKTGWNESHISAIFAKSDYKLLEGKETGGDKDLNDDVKIDNKTKSVEAAGAIWSGVYSLSLGKLDVLMTNMDDDDHTLTLPDKISNYSLSKKSFSLDGGTSLLIEYKLANSGPNKTWSFQFQQIPFLNLSANRNEVGIPEPTTAMSLAAIGALAAVSRRRNRSSKPKAEKKNLPAGLIGGNLPSNCFVL